MSYYSGIILSDTPIAYWRLGDAAGSLAAADSSGNAHTATAHAGVTFGAADALAKDADTAAAFSGTSTGYLACPNLAIASGPFSLEAWLNLTGPGSLGATTYGCWLGYDSSHRLLMHATTGNLLTQFGGNFNSVSSPSLGVWHHIVYVWDGTLEHWYVDGAHDSSHTPSPTPVWNSAFDIGTYGAGVAGANYAVNGMVDEVAVYTYALSAAQIGNHYAAGHTGPQQYFIQIGGKQANLNKGTLSVQNQIGQRSTGAAQVWSPLGTVWQYGTEVQVFDDTNTLVYSGFTTKDKVTKGGSRLGQGYLEHSLTLMDSAYKADKRITFYSNTNTSAGAIVQDLVNKVLYAEGVTYTAQSVASGPTIPEVVWNGKQISACLDFLAKQAGFWWNIDINSVLWFQPYGGVPAPFILDGTQVEAGTAGGLSVEFGNDQYVNTQFTKGGNAEKGTKTAPLDETFHGNGVTRSFTLSYPVSTIYNVILNGVDVTAQSLTKGSGGGSFYYAPGDAVIAQDPSQTVLGSGDTLEVKYSGRVPAIGKASNATLIAAQKTREGGNTSGIVESVYSDTKVHTLPAALQIASALLAHYGADTTVLEFDTRTKGLSEGQMLTVNLSDFGLSNKQMLISSVTISDQLDGYNIWFHVQCVGSPYETAQWQTYWQNLMNQQADPSDLSDVNDTQLTPIVTSTFSHSPLFSVGGFKTSCPICGSSTLCGPSTIVC